MTGPGAHLGELAEKYGVPGSVLGILRLGDAADGSQDVRDIAVHGVLNRATGVEVTPDSVFQVGSITKVWTATLIMQLAERGELDLDSPVCERLPELAARPDVTARHLLAHTSGIDGDLFIETGRGDDAVARLVTASTELDQVFEPGTMFSYCNVGFEILGRLVEVVTGMTWDAAVRDRLVVPLGLRRTTTLPEDTILHRAAVGHVRPGGSATRPVTTWMFPRAAGPAGLLNTSVDDLLTFVRAHLRDGVHVDGTRVLGVDAVRAMQEPQMAIAPALRPNVARGLGWRIDEVDGQRVLGHHGAVIGQFAYLEVVPDAGVVIALLTNGPGADGLWHDLRADLLPELAGLDTSDPGPGPAPDGQDLHLFTGTYRRRGESVDVRVEDGRLRGRFSIEWDLEVEAIGYDEQTVELHPTPDPGVFVTRGDDTEPWSVLWFDTLTSGRPYLFVGERVTPKH